MIVPRLVFLKKIILCLAVIFFLLPQSVYADISPGVDLFAIGKRRLTGPPVLSIVQPQNNASIFGSTVTFEFVIDNMVLVNPDKKAIKKQGEGHLQIWLDKTPLTSESAIHYGAVIPYIFNHVSPGTHSLVVEVVNNDNTSFSPKVMQIIQFETIGEPAPTLPVKKISPTPTPQDVIPMIRSDKYSRTIAAGIALLFMALGVVLWRYNQ